MMSSDYEPLLTRDWKNMEIGIDDTMEGGQIFVCGVKYLEKTKFHIQSENGVVVYIDPTMKYLVSGSLRSLVGQPIGSVLEKLDVWLGDDSEQDFVEKMYCEDTEYVRVCKVVGCGENEYNVECFDQIHNVTFRLRCTREQVIEVDPNLQECTSEDTNQLLSMNPIDAVREIAIWLDDEFDDEEVPEAKLDDMRFVSDVYRGIHLTMKVGKIVRFGTDKDRNRIRRISCFDLMHSRDFEIRAGGEEGREVVVFVDPYLSAFIAADSIMNTPVNKALDAIDMAIKKAEI
jgi:hypothetical protein